LLSGQHTTEDAAQAQDAGGAASLSGAAAAALTASGDRRSGGGSEGDEDSGELHIAWLLGRLEELEKLICVEE
jgi:hypothetical protein